MACLASWCASSLQLPTPNFTLLSNYLTHKGRGKLRQQCGVTCLKNNNQQQHKEEQEKCSRIIDEEEDGVRVKRRQILVGLKLTFAAFSFKPIIPHASADEADIPDGFRIYTDGENKFKILIPEGWRVGVGAGEQNGFKSVTAFYPDQNTSSNVSVIITGLGPDFTRMESFGKVDEFAETLVSGLDRSWQRPPGVAAKLINCKSANGFYYIDYSLQNPRESRKYLFSALGMASNGWYNKLYTVTGQFEEGDSDKYGSLIEKAVQSFRFMT